MKTLRTLLCFALSVAPMEASAAHMSPAKQVKPDLTAPSQAPFELRAVMAWRKLSVPRVRTEQQMAFNSLSKLFNLIWGRIPISHFGIRA